METSIKVKICGIKDTEALTCCLEEGADFIGLNFSPVSARNISPQTAAKLLSYLENSSAGLEKPKVVFLFYKTPLPLIKFILKELPHDFRQWVTDDPLLPGLTSPLLGPYSKRIYSHRVTHREDDDSLTYLHSPLLILDSFVPGMGGGTGESFPWEFIKDVKRPFLLAGGLKPENVEKAVRTVKPYGVDVASGVESSPGVKDPNLIRQFIRNAKKSHTQ
ncbi:N-(5'-phosphoribosyl)anthranilate isomerase [Leptospira perolatii]|uniref:N-(5'-phosphoribosyl)anthranilate isomerase n=1 Tax=Leptospira perolatii TaxID=2023191 RepID=A0A2M9ZJM6_9LEPT|nr:phosphoribosylanthranilate isomerase [Leptospira perolatii]PJZ68594.1 N-(5'-phosphoribosyl)anthranilate isomerase [Leptospira perolatii]PJZ72249.1 N-(5'-phosphoribosyl)anthranilate isomerase [Leptospira perolatii]